jgi:hypothetical protein
VLIEYRIALDPIFPPPDLTSNRKLFVNELPQEIKYSLVFDEDLEGEDIRQLFKTYHES